jgi:hypothetical protein
MGGKLNRRIKSDWRKSEPCCMVCEIYIPTIPARLPRFCSKTCATSHATDLTEDMRWCADEHGWWDAGHYGWPDSSFGCWECHITKEDDT